MTSFLSFVQAAGVSVSSSGTPGTIEKLRVNTPPTVDNLATAIIATTATGERGLVLQGQTNQTASLLLVQNSSGVTLGFFGATGFVGTPTVTGVNSFGPYIVLSDTFVRVLSKNAGHVVFAVRGFTAQTGDLTQWHDVNGAVFGAVSAAGALTTTGTTTTHAGLAAPAFTTASSGTAFYYQITAINAAGESVGSTSLGMANATSALAWTQVAGATGYSIYRNTTNSFTAGSLLVTTITNGTTVAYTDVVTTTTAGLPPTAPTGTRLIARAWANQTANIQEWQNSASTALAAVNSSGGLSATTTSATGLTGAVAASRLVGATASGAPTTGTFAKGDVVVDQAGKMWVNTTAGTPGTWTDSSSSSPFFSQTKWGVD